MGLRGKIHIVIGAVGALAAIYWLFYQLDPESAPADLRSMREYKLSKLTAGEIASITAQAQQEADAQPKVMDKLGHIDMEIEQQRFDWHVMGSCLITSLTIREARRVGCLPPK